MTTHILVKNINLICHNNRSPLQIEPTTVWKKKTLLTVRNTLYLFVRKSAKLLVPLASFEKKNKAEEKVNFKIVFSSISNSCDVVSTMYLVSMTTHLGLFCIFATKLYFVLKCTKRPTRGLLIYYCEFQQSIEQGPEIMYPIRANIFQVLYH